MNNLDPKKLIAGFLLLATVVTSSALLFISNFPQKPTALPTAAGTTANNVPPRDVFVESVPDEPGDTIRIAPGTFPTSTAPGNTLTGQLVLALGQTLDAANENGVVVTPDGNARLKAPSAEQLVDALLAENGRAAVKLPDWEKEIGTQHITVLTRYTTGDIDAYNKEIGALMEEHLTPPIDPSPLDVSNGLASISFGRARTQGVRVVVPEPLAGFHWSLMKMLAYQDRAIALTQLANTDPVRAALIAQAQELNYLNAIELLRNEARKRTTIKGLSGLPTEGWLAALTKGYLGIPTAHAAGWLTMDLLNLARDIWEYVKMIVTEKLKDILVHKLVMQTINWIQGGGKPQFITNWKGFLTDTAKNEAGKMIDTIMPGLCTSFAPLVRVAVIPVDPNRDLDALPSCTIDRVVQNVQNFAQSFENGGWIAYGAAMQPSNNLIGSIIQSKMLTDLEGKKGKEAAANDAEASHGALSSKVCVKYGDPIRGTTETGVETLERGPCVEWKNTTPGEVLTSAIKDSGAAPLLRIVNAEDMAAILNALINAALSKLVKLGQSTVSKGLLGLNMAKQDAAGDACANLTGKDLTDCQAGWQAVDCAPNSGAAPVTTGASVQVPGTPGTPGENCDYCGEKAQPGEESSMCCGDAAACPGLNDYGTPNIDCQAGCFGPTTAKTCGGTEDTPGGTATGGGTGVVNFPNSVDCTGGTNL